jgi:XTP/dITP diphosphohydrolase
VPEKASVKMDIVIASNNSGKVEEIKKFYKKLGINFLSLKDFPHLPKIGEKFKTYERNALEKAKKVSEFAKMIALADDSGLEIDALKGKPGIHSARFGGKKISDKERNQLILDLLKNAPESLRTARFVCVIAIAEPEGENYTVKSVCEGMILKESRGNSGFGYDPIFFPLDYKKTFAEMDKDLKNRISHRGTALKEAEKILMSLMKKRKSF